jgi:hypothetical protein
MCLHTLGDEPLRVLSVNKGLDKVGSDERKKVNQMTRITEAYLHYDEESRVTRCVQALVL